jgi:hypothetical protein
MSYIILSSDFLTGCAHAVSLRNPSEPTTGKLAENFPDFFVISIIPLGVVLAVVYGNTYWLLQYLTLLEQQRAVVLVIGTMLTVAGLMVLATSTDRSTNHLVHTVGLFIEGNWDQRANIRNKDEIGVLNRF